jgi:hypothetical protein
VVIYLDSGSSFTYIEFSSKLQLVRFIFHYYSALFFTSFFVSVLDVDQNKSISSGSFSRHRVDILDVELLFGYLLSVESILVFCTRDRLYTLDIEWTWSRSSTLLLLIFVSLFLFCLQSTALVEIEYSTRDRVDFWSIPRASLGKERRALTRFLVDTILTTLYYDGRKSCIYLLERESSELI